MVPDILGRYGPYFFYTYTLIMGLGVLLAIGVSARLAKSLVLPAWLDGMLAAAVGMLLAGRIIFVWLNAGYFAENPFEAWQIQLGGLNYHGALWGGLVGLWLWSRLTRRSFYRYAGLFAPGLALLSAFGWAACRFEGCAYGLLAPNGLLTANLPDNLGVFAVRYQTQLFGALGSLLVFALSLWASGRVKPSLLFWGTLGGLSLVRVGVVFGRGDPAPMVAGVRLDLLVDLVLLSIALIGSAFLLIANRRA